MALFIIFELVFRILGIRAAPNILLFRMLASHMGILYSTRSKLQVKINSRSGVLDSLKWVYWFFVRLDSLLLLQRPEKHIL